MNPSPAPVPALDAPVLGLVALVAAALALAAFVERGLRRALAGQPPVPERWFGFALRVQWATLAVLGGWPWAVWQLTRAGLRPTGQPAWDTPLLVGLALVPAFLFGAWAQWRSNEGMRRLRGLPWSVAESLERAAAPWVGTAACITGLAVTPAMLFVWPVGLLVVLLACVAIALLMANATRRYRPAPASVTTGELRDRLFALAARAGVRLEQLYVVPMERLRLANAFAVQGRSVVLTDFLLDHLGRDEVDAVLAHELAHHRLGHPGKLAWALLGVVAAPFAAMQLGLPGAVVPVMLVAGLLGFFALSRRFEYAADAGAVALGAAPSALIGGLEALGRVNHVPDRWSRAFELWLTHPSLERRRGALERLGTAAVNAPADRATAPALADPGPAPALADPGPAPALADPGPAPAPADRYAIPIAARSGAKVFSTSFKLGIRRRIGLTLLASSVFVPAIVFASQRAYLWQSPRPLAWLIAVVSAAAVCVLAGRVLGGLPHARLSRRLRERDGAAPRDAWLVGYAPGPEARVFEGFHVWDLGFLSIEGGRLVYRGEETSFSIPPDLLADVALVSGPPAWGRTRVVRLEWDDEDGRTRYLRLVPLAPAARGGVAAACRAMYDAIAAWRDRPAGATDSAGRVVLPQHAEVTSASPRQVLQRATLTGAWVTQAIATAIACVMLRLPFDPRAGAGLADVWLAAAASYAIVLIPVWRHREPARVERRAAAGRAAA